tara:strand:+ start:394 stop:1332 length:939 start_codon:yes stop_codon:yes gene_type:complete
MKKTYKNILVTGCAGFIGSNLSQKLIKEGYRVIGIDNLSTGHRYNIHKKIIFFKGDCNDKKILSKVAKFKLKMIYHMAGQSSGEKSFYEPEQNFKDNLISTFNILNLADKVKCNHVVYASSMSVYGNLRKVKASEKNICKPLSYYGRSKLESEKIIKYFYNLGINFTTLRFFSVYGFGQYLGRLDQGMIRIFISQILKNKRLIIKGKLTRVRDFIYIEDVVNYLFEITKNKNFKNKIVNIGTGKGTSVSALVKLLRKKLKINFKFKEVSPTPLDQDKIYADTKLLKKISNYKIKYSLEKGIEKYITYLRYSK